MAGLFLQVAELSVSAAWMIPAVCAQRRMHPGPCSPAEPAPKAQTRLGAYPASRPQRRRWSRWV